MPYSVLHANQPAVSPKLLSARYVIAATVSEWYVTPFLCLLDKGCRDDVLAFGGTDSKIIVLQGNLISRETFSSATDTVLTTLDSVK